MKFSTVQWISWLVATVTAALTMSTFVYSNFETKQNSAERINTLEKRLDRIENKLDRINEMLK
jgi:hypothetical protein